MLCLGEGCAVLLATTITADYLSLLSLFGCALGKAVVHSAWAPFTPWAWLCSLVESEGVRDWFGSPSLCSCWALLPLRKNGSTVDVDV